MIMKEKTIYESLGVDGTLYNSINEAITVSKCINYVLNVVVVVSSPHKSPRYGV